MYSYTPKIILVKTIFAGGPSIPSDVVCYDCTMRSWRRQGDSDGGTDNVWLHTQASLRVTVVFSTKKRRGTIPRAASPTAHTTGPEPPCPMPPIYRIWPSPGATKSRLSATALSPWKPRRLRVAQNNHIQARQPRVVCNIQPKVRASRPPARDGYHQPPRPQTKQILSAFSP